MSKQYLTTHTIDDAHPTDIFTLAVTPKQVLSGSGSSSIKIYDTSTSDFPLSQVLEGAHKLGCHHLTTSSDGLTAASVGFGGELKLWKFLDKSSAEPSLWQEEGTIVDNNKAGEIWAISLSPDGRFLASTTVNGCVNVWDLSVESRPRIRKIETKGSFGMCIDMSADGVYTASGHENGSIYIFSNESGRMLHSLPGLIKPVRAVSFSPAVKLLAAAGDSKIISLYDVESGEQVANLAGHAAWVFSLDWSDTGEFLLSGGFDGKAKVWSIATRQCVATQTETSDTVWSVKWLPKTGRNEAFAVAGASRSISFYREAAGA